MFEQHLETVLPDVVLRLGDGRKGGVATLLRPLVSCSCLRQYLQGALVQVGGGLVLHGPLEVDCCGQGGLQGSRQHKVGVHWHDLPWSSPAPNHIAPPFSLFFF